MWTQIVGAMLVMLAVTLVIPFFLPRTSRVVTRRTSVKWDVAPVVGFFGVLLLALSLTEAIRRQNVDAWALGVGLGIIISASLWIARASRREPTAPPRESWLRVMWRFVRTFGVVMLGALLVMYLAVRVFGSVVEVFIAGALGTMIIVIAVLMFTEATRRKASG